MNEQEIEKKVVSETVAIALGIICIILAISLVGAIAEYTSIQSSNTINGFKTVRFYKASVANWTTINPNSPIGTDEVDFTWKPNNPSNNGIIYVATYFQYATWKTVGGFSLSVTVGNITVLPWGGEAYSVVGSPNTYGYSLIGTPSQYCWSELYVLRSDIPWNATLLSNQNNYTIRFTYGECDIKNLNVLLEVVDGAQSS